MLRSHFRSECCCSFHCHLLHSFGRKNYWYFEISKVITFSLYPSWVLKTCRCHDLWMSFTDYLYLNFHLKYLLANPQIKSVPPVKFLAIIDECRLSSRVLDCELSSISFVFTIVWFACQSVQVTSGSLIARQLFQEMRSRIRALLNLD